MQLQHNLAIMASNTAGSPTTATIAQAVASIVQGAISAAQSQSQQSNPPVAVNLASATPVPRQVLYAYTFLFPLYVQLSSYLCRNGLQVILPSFLRRRSVSDLNASASRGTKKPKVVKSWDRDVICLPLTVQNKQQGHNMAFPRGRYRASLAQYGLIGKLWITSDMTEDDVANEILSIFKVPMKNQSNFPFVYLQSTGGGAKSLMVPSVSSSFKWTAEQVVRLAGQKGTIYILAQEELNLPLDIKVISVRM